MGAVPPEVSKKWHDEIVAETERLFCTKSRVRKLKKELDLIAFSDLADVEDLYEEKIEMDENGEKIAKRTLLKDLPGGKSKTVKKIKRTRETHYHKDGTHTVEERTEIELHPKLEGIKTLIEVMGIKAPEKFEHDLSSSLMAAVAAHLSGKNDPAPKD